MKLSWFYNLDPSLITLALIGGMLLAAEAGYRAGLHRHAHAGDTGRGHFGIVLGSILGLVALLLSFTFNMSAQRYENRLHLVMDYANALNALYLRSSILPEPQRKQFKPLLRRDIDALADLSVQRPGFSGEKLTAEAMQVEELHLQMWELVRTMAQDNQSVKGAESMLALLSEAQALGHQRFFAYLNRVPEIIMGLLLGAPLIAMGAVGFAGGLSHYRGWLARIMLILLMGGTVFIILNLDQPRQGLIQIDQSPILLLRQVVDSDRETSP